jgi:hypothetical protein
MGVHLKIRLFKGGLELLNEGKWQPLPEGTLYTNEYLEGYVRAVKVPPGTWRALRYSKDHQFVYSLHITDAGIFKLGTQYGYRIKLPEEESDLVYRMCRRRGIPLTKVSEPLKAGIRKHLPKIFSPQKHRDETVTDGMIVQSDGELYGVGFKYVVETFQKMLRNGTEGRFVGRFTRTEGANLEVLETVLDGLKLSHRPEWLEVDALVGNRVLLS